MDLYVIPYANPDGITNGYTNNGPGRCTVSTGIDMNRCWPASFTPYYTSRNYTGNGPLGAPEAVALRALIQNNMGINENIILDIHGWLNITYGDAEVGKYFGDQFGFGHSSTYGSGYLETWGKSIGAKSCLVELPMPSSSSDIINRDFSGKLTNAIRNMLNGITRTSYKANEETKFVKNQTYSKHDDEYQSHVLKEDGNWNSMEDLERAMKNNKMISTYNRLNQAADDYKDKFKLGSQSLKYYLGCEGGIQHLSDIRTLFLDPKQEEYEYKYLNYNMDAAEYFSTETSSFALEEEYDLVVGSYSTIVEEFAKAIAGDPLYEVRVDWFLAAHEFKMGNYSTVEKSGNTYKMYVNFNMCDYYDWDDDNNIFPIDSYMVDPIKETDIRDLHYAGKAKNYENQGTIKAYVEWQAGQSAEQATITIL